MPSVRVTPAFEKALKFLPPHRAKKAKAALIKFLEDPTLPGLRFHALQGYDSHFIICSGPGDRIILRLVEDETYAAVDVGPHDMYRRWDRRRR